MLMKIHKYENIAGRRYFPQQLKVRRCIIHIIHATWDRVTAD